MNPDPSLLSIGIFDSGFGGLTVMRAVMSALPQENIIYFGDTARLPYGEKSADTILRYTLENTEFLLNQGIKLLIIACNTACTVALENAKNQFPIPIIGMIEPALDHVSSHAKEGKVAVLGTRRTINSGVYQQKLAALFPDQPVITIACPLFVPLVEEGYFEHPLADAAVQEYLRPLKTQKIDTILLACTHYPLLMPAIQRELGKNISLIDPAIGCAESVRAFLGKENLLNRSLEPPHYKFFVSDDPEKFRLLGKTFLNYSIEHVHLKT